MRVKIENIKIAVGLECAYKLFGPCSGGSDEPVTVLGEGRDVIFALLGKIPDSEWRMVGWVNGGSRWFRWDRMSTGVRAVPVGDVSVDPTALIASLDVGARVASGVDTELVLLPLTEGISVRGGSDSLMDANPVELLGFIALWLSS